MTASKKDGEVRAAYEIFRAGFSRNMPPAWDDLAPWQRDAMTICYCKGILDGASVSGSKEQRK